MGTWEIAERLGLSRSRTNQLVREKGFPDPVAVLKAGMIWEVDDVEAWIAKRRRPRDPQSEPPPGPQGT